MPKPVNGELDDESVHLTSRGLFVETLNYPLDMNKVPSNGHEYIHLVRQEHAAIFPEETKADFQMIIPEKCKTVNDGSVMSLQKWKNSEACYFSSLALQIRSKRAQLMEKFPKRHFPPVQEAKDCCVFCLGMEMYSRIYGGGFIADFDGAHPPYLSIVLHFSQEEILVLLGYMSEWSTVIGMNNKLCRWIYALMACLRKPVSDDCEAFLEDFYDSCVQRIKECDKSEKNQLHFVSSILIYYFCVKAYKIGTPLERFKRLMH